MDPMAVAPKKLRVGDVVEAEARAGDDVVPDKAGAVTLEPAITKTVAELYGGRRLTPQEFDERFGHLPSDGEGCDMTDSTKQDGAADLHRRADAGRGRLRLRSDRRGAGGDQPGADDRGGEGQRDGRSSWRSSGAGTRASRFPNRRT